MPASTRHSATSPAGPLVAGPAEHLSAYYAIEYATADRAQSIAGRVLDHHVTAVEVRAIHDSVGM